MPNDQARLASKIALVVLLIVLLYDAYISAVSTNDTISNVISTFNGQTGGLVALVIAVLWISTKNFSFLFA